MTRQSDWIDRGKLELSKMYVCEKGNVSCLSIMEKLKVRRVGRERRGIATRTGTCAVGSTALRECIREA